MSRIAARFAALAGRPAFVPYVAAGDPDLATTERICWMLAEEGADIVELGVPFTDPIADGPINQHAAQRALDRGVTPGDVLDLARRLRQGSFPCPIVLFTYANPLLRLLARGEPLDVDGVLVTDLPPEEGEALLRACAQQGVDPILLVSPTTPPERLDKVRALGRGFVYCISSKGVTGARDALPAALPAQVAAVRAATGLPVCVGFGIGTRAVAAQVCGFADGFVVGSALVSTVAAASDPVGAARDFVRALDPREPAAAPVRLR